LADHPHCPPPADIDIFPLWCGQTTSDRKSGRYRRAETILLVELDGLVLSDQIACLVGVMFACILGVEHEQILRNIADTLPEQFPEAKAMWHYAGPGP
jgi:hypothetical protein